MQSLNRALGLRRTGRGLRAIRKCQAADGICPALPLRLELPRGFSYAAPQLSAPLLKR